jgi:atlastin
LVRQQVCGGDKPYLTPSLLATEHERCRAAARKLFESVPKMGGGVFSDEYLARLDAEIETTYDSLIRHNAAKNVFAGFRTPAVLGAVAVALYLLSGLMGMLGLLTLANCCNLALIADVLLSAFWIYARFTGNYTEIATQIDSLANGAYQVSTGIYDLHESCLAGQSIVYSSDAGTK